MRVFIAIDDTDNKESKGTGFRARELAGIIQAGNLADVTGVTRHQLFVHDNIPYTSHNSSACIVANTEKSNLKKISEVSADYLITNAADGSDAGLCICTENDVTEEVIAYGRNAKKEVLTMDMARDLARRNGIFLEGYTGTRQGIIGSLAAVGLHCSGNDGRFLHVYGMREIFGTHNAQEILEITGVKRIKTISNEILVNFEKIFLTEWWRPVLKDQLPVLYVEPVNETDYEYRVISKEHIKNLSN